MTANRQALGLTIALLLGLLSACDAVSTPLTSPTPTPDAADSGPSVVRDSGSEGDAASTADGEDASGEPQRDAGGATPVQPTDPDHGWKFVMVADTHVTALGAPLPDLVSAIASDDPELVLVGGDIIQAGKNTTAEQMKAQLRMFQQVMEPLHSKGIPVYPVRGNHEADAMGSAEAWKESFQGAYALPDNGPSGEQGLSYSVTLKNALFIAVDEYVNIHQANQPWLTALLTNNTLPHVFVFGHEPAFKYFHGDCMDDNASARNAFWTSLREGGAKVYLAGHDHFRDLARIDDGDGDAMNDLYQYIVGTGGGPFPPAPGALNGDNDPYTPMSISHGVENGYLLVEVSGEGANDRDVSMTFKRRSCDVSGACTYTASADGLQYAAPSR